MKHSFIILLIIAANVLAN